MQTIITWKHSSKQIQHSFSYLSTSEPPEFKHVTYHETNICNRCRRNPSPEGRASSLGKSCPPRNLFEVLEQMVVVGSKIETTGGMVIHFPARLLQQLLCIQCRMMVSAIVEQHNASTKHPTPPVLNCP
ncbi:hypothetical protein AVEN_205266-1 [Araneus ventricosus]|uniref:Uncharacterized protein n=1 Tax=Araneus ventricosus TaxID=182803 RepID=A0A4Y2EGV8_ARAVE|nr:hypothetical protein AVEN_205266-1 [Araneus ventricosus]